MAYKWPFSLRLLTRLQFVAWSSQDENNPQKDAAAPEISGDCHFKWLHDIYEGYIYIIVSQLFHLFWAYKTKRCLFCQHPQNQLAQNCGSPSNCRPAKEWYGAVAAITTWWWGELGQKWLLQRWDFNPSWCIYIYVICKYIYIYIMCIYIY